MENLDPRLQEVYGNFTTMRRLMARRLHKFSDGQQLPPSQAELLAVIAREEPVQLKDLAKHMQLTPGAITQLVEPLEQRGFIRREPSLTDRRIITVVMTEAGFHTMSAFRKQHGDMMKHVVSVLTDEEIKTMLSIQGKMIDFLKHDIDADAQNKDQEA